MSMIRELGGLDQPSEPCHRHEPRRFSKAAGVGDGIVSTRPLNDEFEMTIRQAGDLRARGDVFRKGSLNSLVTLFGEGRSAKAAEDDVWHQAFHWLGKRGRSR